MRTIILGEEVEIDPVGVVCHNSDCPDVDSDFATTKRDMVKEHFVERYGVNCTASIGTVGLMKTRSTLKDLARLYGVPADEVNRLTSQEMGRDNVDEDEEGGWMPLDEVKRKYPSLRRMLMEHPGMEEAFEKLRGSITNWGTHAGGVLVTDFDLAENLPLRRDKDGRLVTTWQEGIASRELGMMGFIKFDILAIDQLNIFEHTLRLVKERTGREIAIGDIPFDDGKAIGLLGKSDTTCVFQFEAELATKVMRHMNGIRDFPDIASLSTLMRPAALKNGFDVEFGKLRDGASSVYLPDCLKPYLEKTYGLPIYQEHIMQSAMALAGFDKVTAYKFMKLIYKGKLHTQEEKDQWRRRFVEGAQPKVDSGEVREGFPNEFFDKILAFLGYGFCASHALSYAAYSAVDLWFKAYWPLEFMCANLNVTERAKEDKKGDSVLSNRVGYCRRLGIDVLPPDVRCSMSEWTIHDEAIVASLTNVKGFGENDARAVVENRPYTTFKDFVERTRLGKSKVDLLIFSGALDCFGDRNELYDWYHNAWLGKKSGGRKAGSAVQESLFSLDETSPEQADKVLFSKGELDSMFIDLNGFPPPNDMLVRYARLLDGNGRNKTVQEALSGKCGRHFTLLCKVEAASGFTSRTGREFTRLVLTDGSAMLETILSSHNYKRFQRILSPGTELLLPMQSSNGGLYIDDLEKREAKVLLQPE